MKVVGIIPARLHSTRLPEKLIRKVCGKYIIQYVWEQALKVKSLSGVIIAVDDKKLKDVCEGFGARTVMTKKNHNSGTDRIREVVSSLKCDLVVNIQGDEPLIEPKTIESLIKPFYADKKLDMATLVVRETSKNAYLNPNIVKVVFDSSNFALYFSRSPIPFYRDKRDYSFYRHLGLYAYKRNFLLKLPRLRKRVLENSEKLEQLRILENGFKIKVVEVKSVSVGIDTLEDLNEFERILKRSDKCK